MISIKISGLNRTVNYLNGVRINLPKAAQKSVDEIANRIKQLAKNNLRMRTIYHGKTPGALLSSIQTIKVGEKEVWVQAKEYYAGFVELGTKPHLIPNAFGKLIMVQHPGAKPMYFFADAVNQSLKEASDIIARNVGEVLK